MGASPETIKPIPLADLRPGMFVHELPCRWLDHPFLRSRFLVTDEAMLAAVRRIPVETVWIDTARGIDVESAPQAELEPPIAPPDGRQLPALEVWHDAVSTVEAIMAGARAGHAPEIAAVEGIVADLTSVIESQPSALYGLAQVRSKDRYTFEHCVAVAMFAIGFARTLGLDADKARAIGTGALLHDFGKVRIPDVILNKPGRLTQDEFSVMQRHAEYTREIVSRLPLSEVARSAAADHHERLNGSGYPRALAGDQVSLGARIVAICDVYDAMTADRIYRRGVPPTRVLRNLLDAAGREFDDRLVQHFIRFVGIYPPGALVRLTSQRLAVVLDHGPSLLFPRIRVFYDIERRCLLDQQEIALDPGQGERITAPEDPLAWGLEPAMLARLAVDIA